MNKTSEIISDTTTILEVKGKKNFLPAIIDQADERTREKFVEFFIAQIDNDHTREAYMRALSRFMDWCRQRNVVELGQIRPAQVGLYIRTLEKIKNRDDNRVFSDPTIKLNLAAIRKFFDYLVVNQVIPLNPAAPVKGPKHSAVEGKTPVLSSHEARQLLDSIDTRTVVGLRDRAMIGLMIYSFARVSAAVAMKVKDYYKQGNGAYIKLTEKGRKFRRIPTHYEEIDALDAYIEAAGFVDDKNGPLFRVSDGSRSRNTLLRKQMTRINAIQMVKRRAKDAKLPPDTCCHSFRATGITAYLLNGGDIETAARIAGHVSTRTTQLYNRTPDKITRDEIYRIRLE